MNVYVSEPQAGFVQSFQLREGRQIYFICIEGGIKVNGVQLGARDAARITSVTSAALELEAGPDGAHMCASLLCFVSDGNTHISPFQTLHRDAQSLVWIYTLCLLIVIRLNQRHCMFAAFK